jgi:protein phosphatase
VPRRARLCFEAAGITDQGLVRKSNEDSFAVRPDLGLLVVADGVSRSGSGALASALAVREVERFFEAARRRGASSRMTAQIARARLIRAFASARRRVRAVARRYRRYGGMTTTMVAMVVVRDRVVVAHLGDSRVYRLRGRYLDHRRGRVYGREEEIERLTLDHNGLEDEAWRARHPETAFADPADLQLITRVVGERGLVQVTTRVEKIEPGDTFLLCSDGLHGVLLDWQIEAPLRYVSFLRDVMVPAREMAVPDAQCTWLVERVKQRKAPDNVTVVVARIKKGRGRFRTEREIGHVVHASTYRPPWVELEEDDEDEDDDE